MKLSSLHKLLICSQKFVHFDLEIQNFYYRNLFIFFIQNILGIMEEEPNNHTIITEMKI